MRVRIIKDIVVERLQEIKKCLDLVLQSGEFTGELILASRYIVSALSEGKKIYLFGNGGSAADAQHIAAEFVGRFKKERQAFPVEALTVNTSILTALANDYDYSIVFARQIEAFGTPGDVCIGLSTSGNSLNVVSGLNAARRKRMKTIAITGSTGGEIKKIVDLCLCMPSDDTPRIQEMTILTAHIICELVERSLTGSK